MDPRWGIKKSSNDTIVLDPAMSVGVSRSTSMDSGSGTEASDQTSLDLGSD